MFHYLKHNLALSVTVAGRGSTNGLLCPAPLLCYASFVFTFCRSSLFRYLITLSPENKLAAAAAATAQKKTSVALEILTLPAPGSGRSEGDGRTGEARQISSGDKRSQEDTNRNRIFHDFPRRRSRVPHPLPSASIQSGRNVINVVGLKR